MGIETVPYIIKHSGMLHRDEIWWRMIQANLTVIEFRIRKIPPLAHILLYPQNERGSMPEDAWLHRMQIATRGLSEVGMLRGENAIERLLDLVGRSADPAKCGLGTIRRDFGESGALRFGDFLFHMRVMHRPVDKAEAQHDLPIVQQLLRHP